MSISEGSTRPSGYAEEEQSQSLADILAGLKRRRKQMAIVGAVVLAIAVMAALFWPPTYTSSATILIEEQEIPEDMVRSTITSYANQQVEVIRQRVLTLANIMQLVERFELYDADELARKPRMEIAEDFIDAVNLDLLNADIIDPRSGRPTQATIAFTLDFSADTPRKSLNVANELVNLFLNENLRSRSEQTSSTSDFLRKESDSLESEVRALEEAISIYKSQNQNSLPESFQVNMQNLTRFQSQLIASESRLRELQKRELQLKQRLASTSEYAPSILPTGQAILGDVDRLKALKSEYSSIKARYSPNHPDVQRLLREIETLEAQVGRPDDFDELLRRKAAANSELEGLLAKYSSDHPDVVAKQKMVAVIDQEIDSFDGESVQAEPDNPAYLVLDNELKSLQMEKSALTQQVVQLSSDVDALNLAAAKAPNVEREYSELQRNLSVASAKFLDLRIKLKEAELAGELEEGRKGQRFTLIDPPALPEQPASPNRPLIFFLGVVLALGAALGSALVMEALDPSLRSVRSVSELMGIAPLVTIPYILTPEEQAAKRPQRKFLLTIGGAAVALIIVLTMIHIFYKPLDVLWFVILQKVGL
ncbi:GumC family protein [Candidatus Litorirhabdus singularis]|uniref:GumC family protein n=1 Tax=Candidatus Litorirhabdus singularis TaxID=2518993 RepID=UPI00242DDBD7|nr:Wzz/FepE/Etk N-terminal domain-containing protein [Candidatus Litorirhabdus singularis]